MSSVGNRHATPAAPDRHTKSKTRSRAESGKASFDYGWRYVQKKRANGRVDWVMVPLTLEDVLHPQLEDHMSLTRSHILDCKYLHNVLEARVADDPHAVVLADVLVSWDIPKLKPHSPDVAVILGVKKQKEWKTFRVAAEGVRPSLIIEETSPKTRSTDLERKVKEYARAKVPHYVIADAVEGEGQRRELKLLSYRLVGRNYRLEPLDPQGRVWLDCVGLWLAVTINEQMGGDRLALIDPRTGQEIGDYTAISRRLEAAQAAAQVAQKQAQAAQAAAQAAQKQADAERERAEAEAKARAHAEELLRQAEAELRRLRGEGKKPPRSKRSAPSEG
ncbi:MAG: Uma2 family endonuclease [Isosphaeraceae bacterium]